MENHTEKKGLSRHLVWTLALVVGACGSGGGGSNGGNGGTSSTGHGGSSPAGSGGSGAGGTQGSGGSSAGVAGSSAGGSGGSAGTSGGSGGSAGTSGGSGGSAGSGGGAGGRGGAGGTAGANGGSGGASGHGGAAGANGGQGGNTGHGGTGGGTGGSSTDGGSSDAVVVMDGATMSGGAYVRTAWTATYTCTGTCPAQDSADTKDADTKRAFDGSLDTRWSTGQYQQSTALMSKFPLYFTVDMHETVAISRIVMDPGNQDHFDAPGQMDVLVSYDGTTYTTVVSAHKPVSPKTGAADTIMLPQGTAARYIQLKGTMTIKQVDNTLGDRFWAIGEMNVYGN
ncbi:MAG TPA: discoidin domain-containing protein [Polyangia bacterium]